MCDTTNKRVVVYYLHSLWKYCSYQAPLTEDLLVTRSKVKVTGLTYPFPCTTLGFITKQRNDAEILNLVCRLLIATATAWQYHFKVKLKVTESIYRIFDKCSTEAFEQSRHLQIREIHRCFTAWRSCANAVLGVVIMSVCPSVCLSVTRVPCDKSKQCTTDVLIPYEMALTLVFWHQQCLVGDAPFRLLFAFKVTRPLRKTPTSTDFRL